MFMQRILFDSKFSQWVVLMQYKEPFVTTRLAQVVRSWQAACENFEQNCRGLRGQTGSRVSSVGVRRTNRIWRKNYHLCSRKAKNSPFPLRNSIYGIFAANVAKNLNSTLRTKFWIKSAYELWQPVLTTNLLTLLSKIFVTMVTIWPVLLSLSWMKQCVHIAATATLINKCLRRSVPTNQWLFCSELCGSNSSPRSYIYQYVML